METVAIYDIHQEMIFKLNFAKFGYYILCPCQLLSRFDNCRALWKIKKRLGNWDISIIKRDFVKVKFKIRLGLIY